MATPVNTFTTYDSVGNREDLTDVIHLLDPVETPFASGVKTGKAKATFHEWQTDILKPSDGDNKWVEASDVNVEVQPPTTRHGNYTQIMMKTARVSGTQEAVDKAGRSKEMAYQKMKRLKELKGDMELRLLGNYSRVAGDSVTPREMAGVESWITISDRGAGGADPTGDGTDIATDGTSRAFEENQLQDILTRVWTEGGKPKTVLVGPDNKVAASRFPGISTLSTETPKKGVATIVAAADLYVGNFGAVRIVPSRHVRSTSALILDMAEWKICHLRRSSGWEKLAKTGDSQSAFVKMEYTLEACQPRAHGVVADVSGAP